MKSAEITEYKEFESEILRVLGSTLTLVGRKKMEHGWVNTQKGIKTSLRNRKIEGLGKCHDTTKKSNGTNTIHFWSS